METAKSVDLVISPKKVPEVTGNFDAYKEHLSAMLKVYQGKALTEDTVAPVKAAVQKMRTTLEGIEKTSIAAYYDAPKKLMKARFAELYDMIGEIESKADAVIAEETEKRNNKTTKRLIAYLKSKATELGMDADVVDTIVFEKSYYNKTAKEADVLDDLDRKMNEAKENNKNYDKAVKKLNEVTKEFGALFNKDSYLSLLSKYGESNGSILLEIIEESERLREAMKNPRPAAAKAAPRGEEPEEAVSYDLYVAFPPVKKAKKDRVIKSYEVTFEVPDEVDAEFKKLLKQLPGAGIKTTTKK